jgi:hypothetical protein
MTTINLAVGASANDAKWGLFYGDADYANDSADLWVGNRINGAREDFSIALRFTNVTIPQGATIDAAYVTLRGENTDSTSGLIACIWAADADNQSMPADYDACEALTRTTATASWTDPAVTSGSNINTPSIATVIKEVVDRAGWASGNALVVCIENNQSSDGVYRSFHSYDSNSSYAPVLHIEYTEASSGVSGTLSVTLGAATSSATGTVAVKGTVTKTLAAATLSSAGTIAVKGQLAKTLAGVTLSSAGKVAIKGASTSTLSAVTVSAAGKVAVKGATTSTLAAVTLSATGAVSDQPAITGALSATLGAVTLSATGTLGYSPITGAVTSTLAAVTGAASGKVAVTGGVNSTLGAIAIGAAGASSIKGAAANTLENLTIQATGKVAVSGSANVTLEGLTLAGVIFIGVITTPASRTCVSGFTNRIHAPGFVNRIHTPAARLVDEPSAADRTDD